MEEKNFPDFFNPQPIKPESLIPESRFLAQFGDLPRIETRYEVQYELLEPDYRRESPFGFIPEPVQPLNQNTYELTKYSNSNFSELESLSRLSTDRIEDNIYSSEYKTISEKYIYNKEASKKILSSIIEIGHAYDYPKDNKNETDLESLIRDVAQRRSEGEIVATEEPDTVEYVRVREADAMRAALELAFADFYAKRGEQPTRKARSYLSGVVLRSFGFMFETPDTSAHVTIEDPKLKWMLAHNQLVLADGRPDDAWVAVKVRRKPTEDDVQAQMGKLGYPIYETKNPKKLPSSIVL